MGKNMHIRIDVPTFKEVMGWIKDSFIPPYQSEIEEYLAQSTDQIDLEHRMTVLARRGML